MKDDTLRHQRMSDGHHRQNGETGRLRDEHESEKPPEAIIPCALDAEFVAGLAGSADGRAADKDSGPGSNWTRTRRRGRPTREGVEANEVTFPELDFIQVARLKLEGNRRFV